jgi:hypothetical protein
MSSREEVYAESVDEENMTMDIRVAEAVLLILWTGKKEKKWR